MTKSRRLRVPPVVPLGDRNALRARLDESIPPLLCKDGRQIAPEARERLLEKLSAAVWSTQPGLDLAKAAALDKSILVATAAVITNTITNGDASWNPAAMQRLCAAGDLLAQEVRTAPKPGVQGAPQGAGRPADLWKDALMADVRHALMDANIRGNYWKTGTESTLTEVFRACAAAAGHPIPGDLRSIFRGSRRPVRLQPFNVSRTSGRRRKVT
jgi:hypothetical protein